MRGPGGWLLFAGNGPEFRGGGENTGYEKNRYRLPWVLVIGENPPTGQQSGIGFTGKESQLGGILSFCFPAVAGRFPLDPASLRRERVQTEVKS